MLLSLLLAATAVVALPQDFPAAGSATPSIDPSDPSSANPSSPPKSLPRPSKLANPWAIGGIPIVPPACIDSSNPSDDCFKALAAQASATDSVHTLGGYLAHDGSCKDGKVDQLETAAWDATNLAQDGLTWPLGARGSAAGEYWMGPDFRSQEKRIKDNLSRAASFKLKGNSYITVSCKDTKNQCDKGTSGQAVGGYGWTDSGWFGYYHYITLCPPFFTLDTIDTVYEERRKEMLMGDTSKVTDMAWMKNTGQYFLHEMMHTDLIGQPHISDLRVDTVEDLSSKAYGPKRVHKLAQNPVSIGGGAARSSLNADSYAMLANCLYWWDITEYFPGVNPDSQSSDVTADDLKDVGPISLYFDLSNITDRNAVDFNAIFDDVIKEFDVPPPDPDPAPAPGPKPSAAPAPQPSPAPESPMATENTCDVDYKFFFNRFEIEGRNFNAEKFGMDGSGLKEEISGCGAITDWSFERLSEPNSEFQWKAAGNLPIGTKACVGRAVISAGGSDKDDCTGAG